MDLLATVGWEDIVLVGTAMGIFQGTKMLTGKLSSKPNGKSNGGQFSQALCDEKHKNIDTHLSEIRTAQSTGFTAIYAKLDKIQDHLMNR